MPPAEPLTRLRRVADQEVDLAGTEIARINFDQYLLRTGVNALFINSRAAPFDAPADMGEGLLNKLAD